MALDHGHELLDLVRLGLAVRSRLRIEQVGHNGMRQDVAFAGDPLQLEAERFREPDQVVEADIAAPSSSACQIFAAFVPERLCHRNCGSRTVGRWLDGTYSPARLVRLALPRPRWC